MGLRFQALHQFHQENGEIGQLQEFLDGRLLSILFFKFELWQMCFQMSLTFCTLLIQLLIPEVQTLHLRLHFLYFLLVSLSQSIVFNSELVFRGLLDLEEFADLILSILKLQLKLGYSFPSQCWIIHTICDIQLRIHDRAHCDRLASFCELQGAETFLEIAMMWP